MNGNGKIFRLTSVFASALAILFFSAGAGAQSTQSVDPFYLKMLDKAEKDIARRNYEAAVKNFEIAAFGFVHEKGLLGKAYAYLGICHYHLKNIARSEEYLRQATELVGEEGFASLSILPSALPELDKLLVLYGIQVAQKPDSLEASRLAKEAKGVQGTQQTEEKPAEKEENPGRPQKQPPTGTGESTKRTPQTSLDVLPTPLDQIKEGDIVPLEIVETKPVALKQVQPIYPPGALRAGIEGTVVVHALISERGKVLKTEILRGIRGALELDAAAQRAVRRWEFEPATVKGIRVKVWMPIAIEFKKQELGGRLT